MTHTNRLIHESSPYLLQHAHNPVDWYPWCEEALQKAETEQKPILLSIGYSACHWCHVMERECFENPEIAAIMNENFVSIKVDREERPDLDQIYQTAGQLLSGQGGWPLTVFLTPDQRPFFAGTYFPPEDRFGRPGFVRVMRSLIRTYREEPEKVDRAADQVVSALRQIDARAAGRRTEVVPAEGEDLLAKAAEWLAGHFDREHGGFGSQPKFPNATALELFIRRSLRTGDDTYLNLARLSLRKMARGGIYDQLGGGFHRYATDEAWLIPHFEKMLYDNALLPPVYLQAYQVDGDPLFERVVRETLRYVDREMSHPDGGFYSTQDADSEGVEGKFFVWRPKEIEAVLGEEDGRIFCARFGVTVRGNFEGGTSVLHVDREVADLADEFGLSADEVRRRIDESRAKLFQAREKRTKPGRDEKVIAGWTALMTSAYAQAARVLQDESYLSRAERAASFVESRLTEGDRLMRSVKDGPASGTGYLDDYAFWVRALIDLYEASFKRVYLEKAIRWMDRTLELFWDQDSPGFFYTPGDHEGLIHRPKDWRDQSIPSGTGIGVQNLLRLHPAAEHRGYEEKARELLEAHRSQLDQNPWGTASILLAYDAAVHGPTEVVVVAREDQKEEALRMARQVGRVAVPFPILHGITPQEAEQKDAPLLWRGKSQKDGKVTAYVCRGFSCSPPVTNLDALAAELKARR